MTREMALRYVGFIADDSLSFRNATQDFIGVKPDAVLVGWQAGAEPLFVACQSYLPDVKLEVEEAIQLATDGLVERNWFEKVREPDYIIEQ